MSLEEWAKQSREGYIYVGANGNTWRHPEEILEYKHYMYMLGVTDKGVEACIKVAQDRMSKWIDKNTDKIISEQLMDEIIGTTPGSLRYKRIAGEIQDYSMKVNLRALNKYWLHYESLVNASKHTTYGL